MTETCHNIHIHNCVAWMILLYFLIWALKIILGKRPYDKANLTPYCHHFRVPLRDCACPECGRRGGDWVEWRDKPYPPNAALCDPAHGDAGKPETL